MSQPLVNALSIAAQALDATFAPLVPLFKGQPARWCFERAPNLSGVLLGGDLASCILAHSQDGGGQGVSYFDSQDWSGLVTIKCLSANKATAEALQISAATALGGITAPNGYHITAAHVRPLALPAENGIFTPASLYRLTISKE